MPQTQPEMPLYVIGQMQVSPSWVVTPKGNIPLKGSQWRADEMVTAEQVTPQWAVIAAIVGFFFVCVLSLFFLLAKETQYQGYVDVHVWDGNLVHTERVAVQNTAQLMQIRQMVADAQARAYQP